MRSRILPPSFNKSSIYTAIFILQRTSQTPLVNINLGSFEWSSPTDVQEAPSPLSSPLNTFVLQASGLITQDPATGEPVIHDHSLQRCILLAADANWATLDYKTVEQTILRIISEVHRCLEKLDKLKKKYAMDLDSASTLSPIPPSQNSQAINPSLTAPAGRKNAHPLFSSPKVAATMSRDAIIWQQRSRAVSFFRKVNFG
ncbi:unnamed protein product [Fusarium langsethiae]|nr:unnamed protein product [Fusarium langsethiae]